MKNKEEIQKIINCAPASRAFNIAHTSAANTTVSRAYALVLMLSGAACILMTRKGLPRTPLYPGDRHGGDWHVPYDLRALG